MSELPGIDPPQSRRVRSEDDRFFRAVIALRKTGRHVYRAGRDASTINGVRVPNAAVIQAYSALAQHEPEDRGAIRTCHLCGCTNDRACPGGCYWVEEDLCSACAAEAPPDLGPCCICEGTKDVDNIIMLDRRCAVPGHGWGCVVCGLPPDGAIAVLCDACLPKWQKDGSLLALACRGYPGTEGRIPIAHLPGDFGHDYSRHEAC